MKTRINLTLSDSVISTVTDLSMQMGKSRSQIIDELLTQAMPMLTVTSDIIRKAKTLKSLATETLRQDSQEALDYAENMQKQLSAKLYDIDCQINRKVRQINRAKPPVSNTGVVK